MGHIINFILERLKTNDPTHIQNFLCLVVGPPGAGKSYSSLSFGEQISNGLGHKFGAENMVFGPEEFLKLIGKDNPPGTFVLYEEMGVSVSARDWHSVFNKIMNYVLQTFRHKRLIVFFTVPDPSYVDKQSRGLFHAIIEMQSINLEKRMAKMKVKFIQRNPSNGKTYYKYLRIREDDGNVYKLKTAHIKKPSNKIIKVYEKKRQAFTKKLYKDVFDEVGTKRKIKNPKKLTCKKCNYQWKQRNGREPDRCPNRKCNSRKWKVGVKQIKRLPNDGDLGGIEAKSQHSV